MTEEDESKKYKTVYFYGKNIGKTLKSIRTFYQWKQRELARRANICLSIISEVEIGKRPLSDFVLSRYLKAFSISAEDLFALHSASSIVDGVDFGLLQAFLDMKKP